MSHKNKGFTLVEVLVVVTILSVLVLSLYTVFKSGVDAWSKSEAHLEIFQNARVILDQISRELPGAFVGGDAEFTGNDGVGENSSDTLEFITNFGDSIYKLKYELAADNILERKYIEDPPNYANIDYENAVDEDDGIEEGIVEFGFKVSDIQFSYLPLGSVDWSSAQPTWSGTTLPEAVEIEIRLKENPDDDDARAHHFETIVYLPNSE